MRKAKADHAQDRLCKQLGKQYSIRYIDGERCIYRDLGNNFDVEISRTHTTNRRRRASIYLWYKAAFTVARIDNVRFSNIGDVVEELYRYTRQLYQSNTVTDESLYESTCPR